MLTTRSGRTSQAAARSHPYGSQSSWPGACASLSIETRQPASTACRSSRFGGSSRSGREFTSTATPASTQAAKTTSGSNSDSGRFRAPVTIRPVQCPSTSVCGLRTAATIRAVISAARHPQHRVHARDHEVELGQQLRLLVQRAVVEDVHLDPGEDPERRQLLVQQRDLDQLGAQPLRGQPVRDRQPGRVIGQHHVLVAEVAGGLRHLPDRRATVGPVRMGVAVAAQRLPQRHAGRCERGAGGDHRPARAVLQPAQVVRLLAGQRLGDGGRGLVADARDVAQPAGGGQPGDPDAGSTASAAAARRNARTR